MLTRTLKVRGALTPTKRSAVTESISNTILSAFGEQGFSWAATENTGANGTIQMNAGIRVKKDNFPPEASERDKSWHHVWGFIEGLENILQIKDIHDLALDGNVWVTVESDNEPLLVLLTVEKGLIYYQEASLVWDSKVLY